MKVHALAALPILAMAPAAAFAQQVAHASPQETEKKVCRRVEETGSILGGKRVCHTRVEWKSVDAQNAQNAENARRGQAPPPPRG